MTDCPPSVFWPDFAKKDYEVLVYKGHTITQTDIRETWKDLEKEALALLRDGLLMGLDVGVRWKGLRDDISSRANGYSLLDLPPLLEYRTVLARAFFEQPEAAATWTVRAGDGVAINCYVAREWLANLARLELLLALLIEMRSGAPSRLTELLSLNVRNTSTRVRGLFAVGDYIALIRAYSKTTNNNQCDKVIPSALAAFDASLLMTVQVLLRPFAKVRPAVACARALFLC
jgi:hypothetical protein